MCVAAADLADLIRAKKGFPCWTEGECNPLLPPLLTLRRRHMGEAKCEAEQSTGRGDQGRKRNTGKELQDVDGRWGERTDCLNVLNGVSALNRSLNCF